VAAVKYRSGSYIVQFFSAAGSKIKGERTTAKSLLLAQDKGAKGLETIEGANSFVVSRVITNSLENKIARWKR